MSFITLFFFYYNYTTTDDYRTYRPASWAFLFSEGIDNDNDDEDDDDDDVVVWPGYGLGTLE